MISQKTLLIQCSLLNTLLLSNSWVDPQPKQNIWVTLANVTQQEMLCLSVASPGNPFSTCLVGLAMDVWQILEDAIHAPQKRGYPRIHNCLGLLDQESSTCST